MIMLQMLPNWTRASQLLSLPFIKLSCLLSPCVMPSSLRHATAIQTEKQTSIIERELTGEDGASRAKRLFIARRRKSVSREEAEFRKHAISQVRCVEKHSFHYVKDVMRARKTRNRDSVRTTRCPACASRLPAC